MFGKSCCKVKKGDTFSLVCMIVILFVLGKNTYLSIRPNANLKQLMSNISNQKTIVEYCGNIETVYYESLVYPLNINDNGRAYLFLVKGQHETSVFAIELDKKDRSIGKIFLQKGLFTYLQVSPDKFDDKSVSVTYWPLIQAYAILMSMFIFLRLACVLYPKQVLKIIHYPNKILKAPCCQETVFPLLLFSDVILTLIFLNLLRIIIFLN